MYSIHTQRHEGEIIYVHPFTPFPESEIIPLAVPALINYLPFTVRAYYSWEIKRDVFRKAKVLLMDIHWHFSLFGAFSLANHARKINPGIVIIAGGITASIFAREIVDSNEFDYVISGDAEIPLRRLVMNIVGKNRIPDSIPNVYSKKSENVVEILATDQDVFDSLDFLSIDYFPSLKKEVRKVHSTLDMAFVKRLYPYLVVFKGCPLTCDKCAGSIDKLSENLGRSFLIRSPRKVRDDLVRIAADKHLNYVYCTNDFITQLPQDYSSYVFFGKYKLKIYYEFICCPTPEYLEILMNCFSGGQIGLSLGIPHASSQNVGDIDQLIEAILMVNASRNYKPVILYNSNYSMSDAAYLEALLKISRRVTCEIRDVSNMFLDLPVRGISELDTRSQLEYFMQKSKETVLRISPAFGH